MLEITLQLLWLIGILILISPLAIIFIGTIIVSINEKQIHD